MTDVREGVHMMLCKYLHHHLAPSRIWFIENEEISFTSFEHSKVSNRRYVCKLKCPNQIKPGSPKNLWFSTDLMWHKKYQSFFCVTCKVVKVAANGNLPFNLHLDFWKSRSWKIKVCFILWNYFRSCKPGFFSRSPSIKKSTLQSLTRSYRVGQAIGQLWGPCAPISIIVQL